MSKDESVPVFTVDQLLDHATQEFVKRYNADNGEAPSDEQVAEFRGQILEQAQKMNDEAMKQFEIDSKKPVMDLIDPSVVAKAAAERWDAMRNETKEG
jgi:hypothetical protein